MSFIMTCDACKRADWANKDGERHALEVCFSDRHNQYRCQSCHFKPTADEMRKAIQ